MKRRRVDLTEREVYELTALLNMVLTNGDQWAWMDLAALRRVEHKVSDA